MKKNIKRYELVTINVERETIISLISTGATPHAQTSESKFRNINFTKVSYNKIEINLDSNRNNLQNETYLLFLLNHKSVPSEEKIIFIN